MRASLDALLLGRENKSSQSRKFNLSLLTALPVRAALAAVGLAGGIMAQTEETSAVPSFARQTGYYCSTCHTAIPELTPFGRQFKLNGYTQGGTRCGDIKRIFGNQDLNSQEWTGANFSGWVLPTFTHTGKGALAPGNTNSGAPTYAQTPGYATNDNIDFSDASIFFNGQIYCNFGVFSQWSYSRPGNDIFMDNNDWRYTGKTKIAGNDVVWGIDANNNPTVQDVWNTVPAWVFPWVPQDLAPGPKAGTMIEGTFGGRAASTGAYVWVNNMFYAEFSAYRAYDQSILNATGSNPSDGTPRFDGTAPYWRVAVEKTWNENSFEVGTYGMYAAQQPTNATIGNVLPGIPSALAFGGATDKYLDVAVDAQYQYIGDIHAFTVRAYYIWENQKLDATYFAGNLAGLNLANRSTEELESFNASASYIYDRHISASVGYTSVTGTYDTAYWGTTNGKPDTQSILLDLAYIPYPYGGPDFWPWLNARIGITYTHYLKFNGVASNVDATANAPYVRNASDFDTTFVYAWIDF
jgi:hypothetical protein